MPLGIARQQSSCGREGQVIADRSEDVAEFAILWSCIESSVGRKQRKMRRAGHINGEAVANFLLAMKMTLEFDVHVCWTENSGKPIEYAGSLFFSGMLEGECQRSIVAAG